jgi:hypothetical protein
LDSPQEVLVKRNGKITSYQRFFTPTELQEWVAKELGDGYQVEVASEKNSGTHGLAAVVVTKNNESPAKSRASELGLPTAEASAPMANVAANVVVKAQTTKNLDELSAKIGENKALGPHELLFQIAKSLGMKGDELSKSQYFDIDEQVRIRVADHHGNARTFLLHEHPEDNLGIVVKLQPKARFKANPNVDYLEYVFYPDKLTDAKRQREIVEGLRGYLVTGDIGKLPLPDRYNGSGKYKAEVATLNGELDYRRATEGQEPTPRVPNPRDVTDPAEMRRTVEDCAKSTGLPIKVVTDITELESYKNASADIQRRMRGCKALFNPATGETVINLSAHSDVEDVMESLRHEIIGHKNLRDMLGNERMNTFLDWAYRHMTEELRGRVLDIARQSGIGIREATEEYFARLAEKPFEAMNAVERTIWQKVKDFLTRMLNKFMRTLHLPEWVTLSDRECRWILRFGWEMNESNPINRRTDLPDVVKTAPPEHYHPVGPRDVRQAPRQRRHAQRRLRRRQSAAQRTAPRDGRAAPIYIR